MDGVNVPLSLSPEMAFAGLVSRRGSPATLPQLLRRRQAEAPPPRQKPLLNRCPAPGCGAVISANRSWCLKHRDEVLERVCWGRATQQEVNNVMRQTTAEERIQIVHRMQDRMHERLLEQCIAGAD